MCYMLLISRLSKIDYGVGDVHKTSCHVVVIAEVRTQVFLFRETFVVPGEHWTPQTAGFCPSRDSATNVNVSRHTKLSPS
jgi:hypothetical protein